MEMFLNPGLWAAMLRIATPLMLAAMGGVLCQKAGVFNIALEGHMLIGAFAAITVVHYTMGNVWLGMLGAMFFGMLYAVLLALAIVKFRANHIIAGIAMNMLALGLTSYLLRAMFNVQGSVRPAAINRLSPVSIPIVRDIPFVGGIISEQSIVTYVAVITVVLTYILVNKTRAGLNICSVGELVDAARTAGVDPDREQWKVLIICGALCGLAGAYLSTTIVSQFSEDMIQGRGFNAFTAVAFGNANPIGTGLVTLLFGLADAIGIRLELMALGVPPSIIKMFPFVLALIALMISSYNAKLKRLGVIKS